MVLGANPLLLMVASIVCLCVPFWTLSHFPTQDGPAHLNTSFVIAWYDRIPSFAAAFRLYFQPAGNMLYDLLCAAMIRLLGPMLAERFFSPPTSCSGLWRCGTPSTFVSQPIANCGRCTTLCLQLFFQHGFLELLLRRGLRALRFRCVSEIQEGRDFSYMVRSAGARDIFLPCLPCRRLRLACRRGAGSGCA